MNVTTTPVSLRPRTEERPFRLVSVGDSLTAGMQDATLIHQRQDNSYSAQIARQAGLDYKQPLISENGIPPHLFNNENVSLLRTLWRYLQVGAASVGPLGVIAVGLTPPELMLLPIYHAGGMGQTMPGHREAVQNLAIPGFELRHMTNVSNVRDLMGEMASGATKSLTLAGLGPYVHSILQESHWGGHGKSEVDRAVEQNPDMVIFWAGNNDALESVTGGLVDDRTLTPMEDQQWTYHTVNPFTGKATPHVTEQVNPGFRNSLVGPEGALTRLLNETSAEIVAMNIPDVTVIPYLKTVGHKMGSLPFRIVLPNGADVTAKIEDWTIPSAVKGDGKNGRTQFPDGTRVGLGKVLAKFVESGDIIDEAAFDQRLQDLSLGASFGEDEVLYPDEIDTVKARTAEYNSLLKQTANQNKRIHLVDANALLNRAAQDGVPLRGADPGETRVTNTYTGLQDARGFEGLFSYDGVHPSDTGYAVVANAIMDTVKADLAANPRFAPVVNAPAVDEKAMLAQDPHKTHADSVMVLSQLSVDPQRGGRGLGFMA